MPSTKSKLTAKELRRLIEKYDIQFDGPIPPRMWPDRYKDLFQVIRDIWANRYDEYIQRTDIDQIIMNKRKSQVRAVVDKSTRFRKNLGSNEGTWRDSVEKPIIDLFEKEVVWSVCLTNV
jgi:hypothetical protein